MIRYTYYDETNNYIAIVSEDTTQEEIDKLKQSGKYDDVRYTE